MQIQSSKYNVSEMNFFFFLWTERLYNLLVLPEEQHVELEWPNLDKFTELTKGNLKFLLQQCGLPSNENYWTLTAKTLIAPE